MKIVVVIVLIETICKRFSKVSRRGYEDFVT